MKQSTDYNKVYYLNIYNIKQTHKKSDFIYGLCYILPKHRERKKL
jgi:hypothetical protein